MIKSRIFRRAGHVARRGKVEVRTGFQWGNLKEGNYLEDPGVDWRIIFKFILDKWDGGNGLDPSGSE